MEYTTLGSTGIEAGRICLGYVSFGTSDWRDWLLDEAEGIELVERARDPGINFFDTADMYSVSESERVLGKALERYRDESDVEWLEDLRTRPCIGSRVNDESGSRVTDEFRATGTGDTRRRETPASARRRTRIAPLWR